MATYEITSIIDGAIWVSRTADDDGDDDFNLREIAVAVELDEDLTRASGNSFILSLCELAQDIIDWHWLSRPPKVM